MSVIFYKFHKYPIKTKHAILPIRSTMFWPSQTSNSDVYTSIWPEFELLQDFMHVLVICKFKTDPIHTELAIVRTRSDQVLHSKAITSEDKHDKKRSGRNLNSTKIMAVLVICKFHKDPIKTKHKVKFFFFFFCTEGQVTLSAKNRCGRKVDFVQDFVHYRFSVTTGFQFSTSIRCANSKVRLISRVELSCNKFIRTKLPSGLKIRVFGANSQFWMHVSLELKVKRLNVKVIKGQI